MITEDYVSFEIAKLLKKKGFNEHCFCINYPLPEGGHHSIILPNLLNNSMIPFTDEYKFCIYKEDFITIPTLQMAMKWLREVHNIHIAIVPCEVGPGVMDYTYILYKVDTENFIFKDLEIQGRANTDKMSASKTCEAAIKYCLENLI